MTEAPRNPRTMMYWCTQDKSHMYGISAVDLQKESHWHLLMDAGRLSKMMTDMHSELVYKGFLSGSEQRIVDKLPPPYAEKTLLLFCPQTRTSHAHSHLTISVQALKQLHGLFAKTWSLRCEPMFACDGTVLCLDDIPLVSIGWNRRPPKSVVDSAELWQRGVQLTKTQLEYLQQGMEVASLSLRHIWFVPPAPQDIQTCDSAKKFGVFYDELTRSTRELSFEDIRLNNIVPLSPCWSDITELVARLPFPVKIDHRSTEKVFPESFVLQFVNKKGAVLEKVFVKCHVLRRWLELHRLAVTLTKQAHKPQNSQKGVLHIGGLSFAKDQLQLGKNLWQAFHGNMSWSALCEKVGDNLFAKLCQAPSNQTEPTSWLVETGLCIASSEEGMRKTFIRREATKLKWKAGEQLVWTLDNFRQKAALHGLEYLGIPRVVRPVENHVTGLEAWLANFTPPISLNI
jgi:hypothetical protein